MKLKIKNAMITTQEWLNNEFSFKNINEIKSSRRDELKGNLIIEDYPSLKILNLTNSKNNGREKEIKKLTLRNLPLLEECFIKDCKTEELIIENCPQIKILYVQRNNLEDLSFLENLNNLEDLNIDENKKIDFNCGLKNLPLNLIEFSYKGTKLERILKDNWKENREKLINLITKNTLLFWDLTVKYEHLKTVLDSVLKKESNEPKIIVDSTDKIVSIFKKDAEDLIEENKILKQELFSFEEQEKKINYLEIRIQELINLIKIQRQKIVQSFVNLLPEKELIQELITLHLEIAKLRKKDIPTSDYREKSQRYKKIYRQLEDDYEKIMEGIKIILDDCTELVNREFELDERLTKKTLYLEQQKETVKQITSNHEQIKIIQNHELINQTQIKEIQAMKKQLIEELKEQLSQRPQIVINNQGNNPNFGTIQEQNNYDSKQEEVESLTIQTLPTNVRDKFPKIQLYNHMNTKNILLIGRTGSGKSTLANILVNQVNEEGKFTDFQEIFKEGAGSTSQTRDIQEEKATINNVEYNIIDTIGIGDTNSKLDPQKVLAELKEKLQKLGELTQIFFVFKDKFSPEDVQAYKNLCQDIFNNDKEIYKFITVVRTRFDNFEDEEGCKEDKERIINEGGEVGKIISACQELIHVNNPSLSIAKKKEANLEERSESRKKLVEYLATCEETYKIKASKKAEEGKTKIAISGGTFHSSVYGEINAGDNANFGSIGTQNIGGTVQTQNNYGYSEEKVKKTKQIEQLPIPENNNNVDVLRAEIPFQSINTEKFLSHQKRISIRSINDIEGINLISADDLSTNIYQLTLDFLKTKDYFYLARKKTIENLQNQIQELENRINKTSSASSVAEFVINIGSFVKLLDHGITETIGKGSKIGAGLLSSSYISEQGKRVHLTLKNSEEEINNAENLDYNYTQLNSALNGQKEYDLFGILDSRYHRAFKVDYQIYDLLTKQINVWPDRSLNRERLEQIYTALQTNLSELDQEINSEFRKLKSEDQAQIRKENELKLETNQAKIIDKEQHIANKEENLKLMISSLKTRLRSKSNISPAKKQEREKKLTNLFEYLPNASQQFINHLEAIKTGLSKNLSTEEINKLYQIKQELEELTQFNKQIEQSTTK